MISILYTQIFDIITLFRNSWYHSFISKFLISFYYSQILDIIPLFTNSFYHSIIHKFLISFLYSQILDIIALLMSRWKFSPCSSVTAPRFSAKKKFRCESNKWIFSGIRQAIAANDSKSHSTPFLKSWHLFLPTKFTEVHFPGFPGFRFNLIQGFEKVVVLELFL